MVQELPDRANPYPQFPSFCPFRKFARSGNTPDCLKWLPTCPIGDRILPGVVRNSDPRPIDMIETNLTIEYRSATSRCHGAEASGSKQNYTCYAYKGTESKLLCSKVAY